MSIYSSFFSPQTISVLFCLHQILKQGQQIDAKDQVLQFLVGKILRIMQVSENLYTNLEFHNQLLRVTKNETFMNKYELAVQKIVSFNDFYGNVSNILKSLRNLRTNKMQQGNLIDFFVRRLHIYFQKLDFKEIVQIYQHFSNYKTGHHYKHRSHQFELTKSIQEVKFNLENYPFLSNSKNVLNIVQQLSQNDHTFKTSYLKGLIKAQQRIPQQCSNQIHRYFDKCLGNLFQQKTQSIAMSNKINHCILSTAYVNLKMQHLQSCLQSISQGLRISQNNSDQQSINNCIIYLYKIGSKLGKFKQSILLTQHAITHSLNLSNILLMVYSCLNYSSFQLKYDCNEHSVALLKSRNINWTDALHFSKKKIYSNYQSNCKNIYHSHRNLLIPTFLHKIAVLLHLPELQNLLINPYYQRPQLLHLQIWYQYKCEQPIDQAITQTIKHYTQGRFILLPYAIEKIKIQKNNNSHNSPSIIIRIQSAINQLEMNFATAMHSYKNISSLIGICRINGYVKQQLLIQENLMSRILISNELYYDALINIQSSLIHCKEYNLNKLITICLILQCQVHIKLGNIIIPLEIIKSIQQSGSIQELNLTNQIIFYQMKYHLNSLLYYIIQDCQEQQFILILNQLQCKQTILSLLFQLIHLPKIIKILQEIKYLCLILKNHQKLINCQKALIYTKKISMVYLKSTTVNKYQTELLKKAIKKIQLLYND